MMIYSTMTQDSFIKIAFWSSRLTVKKRKLMKIQRKPKKKKTMTLLQRERDREKKENKQACSWKLNEVKKKNRKHVDFRII